MDSLTQGLLGATTFALIKDKDIGKKSLVIGAIAGTIPDLDVFLAPLFSDIEFITVHRSVSHSLGAAILLSYLLGYLFYRRYQRKQSLQGWMFAFFLSIMTHSLLDWCTTYGTKLLSPLTSHLFSTNNIHVFDPIYTFTLLIGTLLLFFRNSKYLHRQRIIQYSLVLSTLYIGWTFTSKNYAANKFIDQLEEQNIEYSRLLVSPTPFNSFLWHGIIKTTDGFYFGTYSLFDDRKSIQFYYENSDNNLIESIGENRLGKFYLDYTKGFPLVKLGDDGEVKIYAVKYGPINYFGHPEFVYPLKLNLNNLGEEYMGIDNSDQYGGPANNLRSLFRRIRGI